MLWYSMIWLWENGKYVYIGWVGLRNMEYDVSVGLRLGL